MQETFNAVKKLSPEVARKIAAGEVIDRPCAVVRELLDNAIDSGANLVCLEIEDGGINSIRVTDNGFGMTKQDLELSVLSHATSKITSEQDLLSLNTLGFRGEALPSIAAVSRLTIRTRRGNDIAWQLESDITGKNKITACSLNCGTIVEAKSIFENFPARRVFLKRPSTEGALCKQTFVEKALAYPKIAFKFFSDGVLRLDLPATENHVQRVIQAMELVENEKLFHVISANDDAKSTWHFTLIIGDSSIYRNNKKDISIFVNTRKITEFSLVQAIEYGTEGSFPNGTHPVACLFLQLDSHLVDFNIHPAKKEARFKDLTQIHHAISSLTRQEFCGINKTQMFHSENNNDDENTLPLEITEMKTARHNNFYHFENTNAQKISEKNNQASFYRAHSSSFFGTGDNVAQKSFCNENYYAENECTECDFKYIGSALNVFLFVEKDDAVYVIDQHAAHERIIYEELMKNSGQKQPLLFPLELKTENENQENYLENIAEQMEDAGFALENVGCGKWKVNSVPCNWQGSAEDLYSCIFEKQYEPKEFLRHFIATCACKAACKEGDFLDYDSAISLIKKVFALPDPHCPHGRPIWFVLSRKELYERVKRT